MNQSRYDLAFLRAKGFDLIPLKNPLEVEGDARKTPEDSGWRTIQYTNEAIDRFAAAGHNLGARITKNQVVLDIDWYKKSPTLSWPILIDTIGFDPTMYSLTTITPNGGYHCWMSCSVDSSTIRTKLLDKRGEPMPGMDIKRYGGFIVLPGSIHPNNGTYAFWQDGPKDIMPMPESLVERQSYGAKHSTDNPHIVFPFDDMQEILRAIPVESCRGNRDMWLNTMMGFHSGTGGDGMEAFVEWSATDEHYSSEEDRQRTRNAWQSLQDRPGGKTVRSLLAEAARHGLAVQKYTSRLVFQEEEELRMQDTEDYLSAQVEALSEDVSDTDLSLLLVQITRMSVVKRLRMIEKVKTRLGITKTEINKLMREAKKTNLEDLGEVIAERVLSDEFGNGLHLVRSTEKRWWVFDRTHWRVWSHDALLGSCQQMASAYFNRAGEKITTMADDAIKIIRGRQAAVSDVFRRTETPLPMINLANGELWLDQMRFQPGHNPMNYQTSVSHTAYVADAEAPLWEQTLQSVFSENKNPQDCINLLHEFFGYTLVGKRNLSHFWIWYGSGGNGKTLVSKVLTKLLGDDAVLSTDITGLDTTRNNHALAMLLGKTLLLDDDYDNDKQLPTGALKKLSEYKLLEANPKGADTFSFINRAVPLILSNSLPRTRDVSKGIQRRAVILPFLKSFGANESDPNLFERIISTELPGILNLSITGFLRLNERGKFQLPHECQEMAKKWLQQINPSFSFVTDCCLSEGDSDIYEIYSYYRTWADGSNIKAMSVMGFRTMLENYDIEVDDRMVRNLSLDRSRQLGPNQ